MRVEGNLLWTRDARRRAARRPRSSCRAAGLGRPAPDPRREDLPGRRAGELHRRPPRAVSRRNGRPTDNRGSRCTSPTSSRAWSRSSTREGFQVHIHTIGDRAVRESLDAFEAAQRANGRRDSRHHLAHLQLVHPDDVPRFRRARRRRQRAAALGLPLRLRRRAHAAVHRDERPRDACTRSGASHRAGAPLAFGSDWTVSTAEPAPADRGRGDARLPGRARRRAASCPDERLDLPTALAAFTIGSAFVNLLERETGSIEPASSPTSSSSTATSSTPAPARSATPGSCSPSSRARRSTRIPRSAGSGF